MQKVDVIIVNYKTKELTAQAARSVLEEPELGEVIIVDNASGDDSVQYLTKELPEARIIASKDNLGFGGGNNLAVSQAKSEYVFLLNSDAYIRPGCLGGLVKVLQKNRTVGLVAPAIFLPNGNTLQPDVGGNFPTVWSIITGKDKQPMRSHTPDWLSGVAFLARRAEYQQIGGFSDRFFMYFEDVDLCRRYNQINLTCQRNTNVSIVHLGGQSKQSTSRQKKQYYQSQDRYLKGAGSLWISRLLVKIVRTPYKMWKHAK